MPLVAVRVQCKSLFLGCGGSGGLLSLRVDHGLEALFLGGGCGGDMLLLDLGGSSNALLLSGGGGGGSFTFRCDPLSLRHDGGLDLTLLDGDTITLRGGYGLHALSLCCALSLLTFPLRLDTPLLELGCGLDTASSRSRSAWAAASTR